jgi:uncharacterized protein YjiS (DUF1127 family)
MRITHLIAHFEGPVMSQATCHAAPPPACAAVRARPAAQAGLPARPAITWFGAALDRIARPWRRRAAIRELHRLSDRELSDIGVERGEVEAVVDELMRGRS